MKEKTFVEYYEEVTLSEVKLSRIWNSLNNEKTSLGIITAMRSEYDHDENIRRNKQLANELRTKGYGYVFADGKWIENEGKPNEKLVSEDSIIVTSTKDPNILKNDLIELSKKYEQEGFTFREAGSDIVLIIDGNGKIIHKFNNVRFNKLAKIYTDLRKHRGTFTFEDVGYTSGGFIKHLINN
jgi:hypothetical protein